MAAKFDKVLAKLDKWTKAARRAPVDGASTVSVVAAPPLDRDGRIVAIGGEAARAEAIGLLPEADGEDGDAGIRALLAARAHALADELVAITGVPGDLAFGPAGHSDTFRHHMHSLPAVDRITQAPLAVADLLRSSASANQRLAAVTPEDLSASVTATWGHSRCEGMPLDADDHDAA